jgi:3-hydroxybutyryl-CoA dehydrogenase
MTMRNNAGTLTHRADIGVLGAGTMGTGVAQVFARAGHRVILVDVDQGALRRARRNIAHDLRLHPLLTGVPTTRPPEEILEEIEFVTDIGRLTKVGYVIENITEKWDAKASLYRELDAVCAPECLFGVNTSAMPITRVGSVTGRADRVIGTHFMNPAQLKPVVEVIQGFCTTTATVQATRELLSAVGLRSILVRDSPGFVTNRVLMLTINEAVFLLHEGVSTAADIDLLFQQCFGHKMGPLATADLIGLDTILYSLEVLLDGFSDPKFRPCPLLRTLVDAGLLGRKTGRGFHRYQDHKPAGSE